MNKINVFSIGKIKNENGELVIKLDEKYTIALKGLEDYSHVQII